MYNVTINNMSVDMERLDNANLTQSLTDLELLNNNWQTLLIILYSLTAALSLVGNVVAIWVLMAGKRSSRELRMFLVNLSLSDITMAIFSIPFTYTDFMFGRWIFMPQFCPIVQFMQLTSVFVSVYTLTAIGIDRYIAIMYPLGSARLTKSIGKVIVAVIWTLAIALGFITWTNSIAEPFVFANNTYFDCKETWTQESGRIYTCIIFIITFGLPIVILTYVYGSVAWKMFRHSAPGNADAARDEAQHNAKIKIIKMLATIVLLFAICWLPIHTLNLLVWFARDWLESVYQTETGYHSYIALTIVSHWLSMANSFVNPIIYCFMSDNFRTDLRILVTKCCPRLKKGHRRERTFRSTSTAGNTVGSESYRTSVFAMSRSSSHGGRSSLYPINTMGMNGRKSKVRVAAYIREYSDDDNSLSTSLCNS